MRKEFIWLIGYLTGFMVLISCQSRTLEGPYFATGIKIGEVTSTEAIVWVRLTRNNTRVSKDAPMPRVSYVDKQTGEPIEKNSKKKGTPVVSFPEGSSINTIEGACPGSQGKARFKYRARDDQEWSQMDWQVVDPEKDFTTQFMVSGLTPGEEYEILVEASPLKSEKISASIAGVFKTAPLTTDPANVNFMVTTGTSYPDIDSATGYKLYSSILELDPEFFIHTGDIVYYDQLAKTADLARWHWHRMYSMPDHIDFHRRVPSYFIKDDHDTWMNDCWPGRETDYMGTFTYKEGTRIFLEEVPMGDKTYRTIRWGKDLQIWLVEGRDYRSPNTMEDGPDKTIWGEKQLEWLTSTVEDSDATFKLLVSPTPVVGPDRSSKKDNHANESFSYEGDLIRNFISEQENMYTVCGDRHWQYISQDQETGVIEFSCGPGSHAHAGGWQQENKLPEHIYLNVVGGFMEVEVSRGTGQPTLTVRHRDPDGKVLNEYVANQLN